MAKADYEYDVFISHAVEDKLPIANELLARLREKEIKVWYSGTELGIGDRLTDSIHRNLAMCRFGVVIISPTYLTKIWALNEFFFLLTREKNGQKVILPVLYDITPEQLGAKSPLMADIFAVRADKGLERVTEVLVNEIKKYQAKEKKSRIPFLDFSRSRKAIAAVFLMVIMAIGGYGLRQWYHISPGKEVVEAAVQKRITELQQKADIEWQQILQAGHVKAVPDKELKNAYSDFTNAKSYYRNEYTLNTGVEMIRSKRNVESELGVDMDTMSPLNVFALASADLYRCELLPGSANREEKYIIRNKEAVTYTLTSEKMDDQFQVKVIYANPIRLVVTHLVFPSSDRDTKRYQVLLTAFHSVETYTFAYQDGAWMLSTIE